MSIKRSNVVSAINKISRNAASREGPSSSREYAMCYSLNMRDAREEFSDRVIKDILKDLAIQVGDDAGLDSEEVLKYWDN